MSTNGLQLFELMPALYRLKDAALAQGLSPTEQTTLESLQDQQTAGLLLSAADQRSLSLLLGKTRGPLQSLLLLIAEQMAIVADDLDQLYDDQFIETCAAWVIPYIGDLIGYQSVNGAAPSVASPRAEVAHTISFRRRKGTILMLEQLARDVTGWGAHAVEMFKLLADTQYMNHIRRFNHYAPDLRRWQVTEYMNTGFDRTAHTLDLRRIAIERGRYNIQNVAVFLWSLNAYPLKKVPLTPVSGSTQFFRFSPLGQDMPLFHRALAPTHPIPDRPDITGAAKPGNVPDRLSRYALCQDIQGELGYYGEDRSLVLFRNGTPQSPIRVCDLAGEDGSWTNVPAAGDPPCIDPELGRVAFGSPLDLIKDPVTASFCYGFNADIAGGEYPRAASFPAPPQQPVVRVTAGTSPTLQRIQEALDSLNGAGVVEIGDSAIYSMGAGAATGLTIHVSDGQTIQLRAADGCRPTLILSAAITATGGADSKCDLNGLLISYKPSSLGGSPPQALVYAPDAAGGESSRLSQLNLAHCTLVPGWALTIDGEPQSDYAGLPTLRADTAGLNVNISQSIMGTLWINFEAAANLTDSIVDAAGRSLGPSGGALLVDRSAVAYVAGIDAAGIPSPGGALTMNGCTVVGKLYSTLLNLVSDCIFWAELSAAELAASPRVWNAALWSSRKQQGCVRFSYAPAASLLPRHFQCVQEADDQPQPMFYSLRYGEPAYAKLWPGTNDAIRRGADDGGEMGAFHFLQAPSRETDLRVRMREYLPVGLEFGMFYEN